MTARGAHTYQEIFGQAKAWQSALDEIKTKWDSLRALWTKGQFSAIVFTGCGSTYYLSLAVAPLFRPSFVRCAHGVPASELFLFPDAVLPSGENVLLVAISRSGQTTETIRAVQTFKATRLSSVVAISCAENSPLVAESTIALLAKEVNEQSVVQTRSFSCMLLLAQAWSWLLADEGERRMDILPTLGERVIAENRALAQELGENSRFNRFFFLGSGSFYGLACEASLKMKEMSLTHSEAFHFLEFRHGPMSMVDEATLVVGLLSDTARDYEVAVLKEMRALGAQTLVLTDRECGAPLPAEYLVCFNSGLPERMRGVFYMPVLQLMAYYRAMHKGLNPDAPKHLSTVVML